MIELMTGKKSRVVRWRVLEIPAEDAQAVIFACPDL